MLAANSAFLGRRRHGQKHVFAIATFPHLQQDLCFLEKFDKQPKTKLPWHLHKEGLQYLCMCCRVVEYDLDQEANWFSCSRIVHHAHPGCRSCWYIHGACLTIVRFTNTFFHTSESLALHVCYKLYTVYNLLIWDFLLSQINIWTTTTWSNVWVILLKHLDMSS